MLTERSGAVILGMYSIALHELKVTSILPPCYSMTLNPKLGVLLIGC